MPRFYIGQPVICVDDRRNKYLRPFRVKWVKMGQRYTIRAYQHAVMPVNRPMDFVLLHEIHNPSVPWSDGQFMEAGFWEERFEPATDISRLEEELMNAEMFVGGEFEIANPAPVRKKEKVE